MDPIIKRMVGLSRNESVEPLLKLGLGKPSPTGQRLPGKPGKFVKPGPPGKPGKSCVTKEDITRPPESSDEETDSVTSPGRSTRNEPEGVDTSEDEAPRKQDMQKTVFKGTKDGKKVTSRPPGKGRSPSVDTGSSTTSSAKSKGIKREIADDDIDNTDDSAPPIAKRARQPLNTMPQSSPENDSIFRPKTKLPGYGAKAVQAKARLALKADAEKRQSERDLKAKKFKEPPAMAPSPNKTKSLRVLRRPGSLPPTPEKRTGEKPKFRQPESLPGSHNDSKPSCLKVPLDLPESTARTFQSRRLKRDARAERDTESDKEQSVKQLKLNLPELLPGMKPDGDNPIHSPNSSGKAASVKEDSDVDTEESFVPRKTNDTCPMCYQKVDEDMLLNFSRGKPMSMRQQMKFCELHKRKSASDRWTEKGYPIIDWEALEGRCRRHHRLLEAIIHGDDSHYRSALASRLATGRERTLQKTERSLAPGYYGSRGLRVMSEHIIRHFSAMLRREAVDDPVISARGTTVFVSTVLVPELATRLIMEDMGKDVNDARAILEESVTMGDLLHEDVGDVVEDADTSVASVLQQ